MISATKSTLHRTSCKRHTRRSVPASQSVDTMQRLADGTAGPRSSFESSTLDREIPSGFVALKEMVHELRDPLTLIMLAAGRALNSLRSGSAFDSLVMIREESVRVEQIMQGAMQRATCQDVFKTVGNLNTVAQRAVATAQRYCEAAPRSRLTWTLDLTEPAPWIPMHAVAIEQVIVNLIKNAVESSDLALRIDVQTVNSPELAEVRVSDNGRGISRRALPRVFEQFVSTKRGGGRGLGLSICNEIVTGHGGQILVQSELDLGSVFTIQLPARAVVRRDKTSGSIGADPHDDSSATDRSQVR